MIEEFKEWFLKYNTPDSKIVPKLEKVLAYMNTKYKETYDKNGWVNAKLVQSDDEKDPDYDPNAYYTWKTSMKHN